MIKSPWLLMTRLPAPPCLPKVFALSLQFPREDREALPPVFS